MVYNFSSQNNLIVASPAGSIKQSHLLAKSINYLINIKLSGQFELIIAAYPLRYISQFLGNSSSNIGCRIE